MPLIPEQDRVKEDLSGDGGVVKVKTSDGGGQKPVDGDIVAVQYVATQGKDGALFDSSRKCLTECCGRLVGT
jgi:FKBP-type peptidyl-prolyl cis-trans isomerase